ncbi:MAG: DUF3102 domain-containing protein [Kiritimatiellia bacterium]
MPAAGGNKALCGEAADLAHNRYHRAARSSAAMAIVYAAMAGRELIEQRKKIKHGGWIKWVEKNCEFSVDTAERYQGVYQGLHEKLPNSARVRNLENSDNSSITKDLPVDSLLKLLERPPSQLLPEETELLLTDIRQATEGQTLRQLYFDFGLATPPKPTGGANMLHAWLRKEYPGKPEYIETKFDKLPADVKEAWKKYLRERESAGLPEGMTLEHFDANTWWTNILGEIHLETTNTKRFLSLDLEELKNVSMSLLDTKRVIDETIKKG